MGREDRVVRKFWAKVVSDIVDDVSQRGGCGGVDCRVEVYVKEFARVAERCGMMKKGCQGAALYTYRGRGWVTELRLKV